MSARAWVVSIGVCLALTGVGGCTVPLPGIPDKPAAASATRTNEVQVGDCLVAASAPQASKKPRVVPCDQPHKAQLFCTVTMPSTDYPTENEMTLQEHKGCLAQFKMFFGGRYFAATDYKISTLRPDEATWNQGAHTIQSAIERKDGTDITGDLKGTMTVLPDVTLSPTVGQCTGTVTDSPWNAHAVEIVDCAQPHFYEVIGSQEVPTQPASNPEIQATAKAFCLAQFQSYVGIPATKSKLSGQNLYPSVTSWETSPYRVIICMAGSESGSLVGSIKGSKR